MIRFPEFSPSKTLPFSSTSSGLTPKNGKVAEPGLTGVTPAIGEIKTDPVSVCHHVSMIWHEAFPTTR